MQCQKNKPRKIAAANEQPMAIMESLEDRQLMSGTVYPPPVEGQLWTPHPFQFSYAGSTASQWKFQVYWGDNTGVQTANKIVQNPEANGLPGYFQTSMSHIYDESGDYTIETTEYFKGRLWQTTDYPIQVADAPLIPTNASITVKANSAYSGVVGSFVDGFPINPDSKLSDFSVDDVFGAQDTKTLQTVTKADITIHLISTGKYQLLLNKPTHLAHGNTYKFGVVIKDVGGQIAVIYCTVNTSKTPAAATSAQVSTSQNAASPFSSDAVINPLAGILDLTINT